MSTNRKESDGPHAQEEAPLHSCLLKVLAPGEKVVWLGVPLATVFATGGGALISLRVGIVALCLAATAFGFGYFGDQEEFQVDSPLSVTSILLALVGLPMTLWSMARRWRAGHVQYAATDRRAIVVIGKPGSARIEVYSPEELTRPNFKSLPDDRGSIYFYRKRPFVIGPLMNMGFLGIESPQTAFNALLSIYERRPEHEAKKSKHVTLYVRGALIKARMSGK